MHAGQSTAVQVAVATPPSVSAPSCPPAALDRFKAPKRKPRDPEQPKKEVTSRAGQEKFARYLYVGSLPLSAIFTPLSRLLERWPVLEDHLREHLVALDQVAMSRDAADLDATCIQALHASSLANIMQVHFPLMVHEP